MTVLSETDKELAKRAETATVTVRSSRTKRDLKRDLNDDELADGAQSNTRKRLPMRADPQIDGLLPIRTKLDADKENVKTQPNPCVKIHATS